MGQRGLWILPVLAMNLVFAADPDSPDATIPSACGPGQVQHSGGCWTLPEIIRKAKPEFPRVKWRGSVKVVINAVIDKHGKVLEVTAVEPFAPKEFEASALEAVRKWRFRPAKDGSGNPVKVYFTVTVDFTRD